MQSFIHFLFEHWVLSLAFIVVLIYIIIEEKNAQTGGGARLTPTALVAKINHDNAVVLDVRSRDVFKQGHIVNAVSVPLADLSSNFAKLNKYKEQPVVVVCMTGKESAQAIKQLKQEGFTQLHLLTGGVNAWKGSNLPLVKG